MNLPAFLMAAALAAPFCVFGQSEDWSHYQEKDGVKISWRFTDCIVDNQGAQRNVLLRFENFNDSQVNVQFNTESYFDGECVTCGDNRSEYSANITLEANSTKEGDCNFGERGYSVFAGSESSMYKSSQFEKFELEGLKVQGGQKNLHIISWEEYNQYSQEKKDYVESNPDLFKILEPSEDKKHVIDKAEFDLMPGEKRQRILNSPDKYVIQSK